MRSNRVQFAALSLALMGVGCGVAIGGETDWPQFRGPNASGVAAGGGAPTDWDGPTNDGIAWKTPIPGLAHSSPIIWGDRLFVTTAVASGMDAPLRVGLYGDGDSAPDMVEHEWKVLCLDKNSGSVLWERTAVKGTPKFKRHTKATHANSTPCTDGKVVVACFGSEGVHAFSLDGEKRWSVDLGPLDVGPWDDKALQWGFAGSPIIYAGVVYLQCDVKDRGFLVALDAADGRELWRRSRQDVPGWCTPAILAPAAAGGGGGATDPAAVAAPSPQIIVNGCKHMGGYDARSGEEIWRMANGGGIPVPTPVVADGLIVLTSNHRPLDKDGIPQPIIAVRGGARGDITFSKDSSQEAPPGEHVAWFRDKRGNYMQTPLAHRGLLYACKDNGSAACYDLKTGAEKWRERLGRGNSGFTASPVLAGDKIYWTSEEGDVYVVEAGAEFRLVSINALGEICMATPAVSDGRLYFRTQRHVIAIGR